MEYHASHFILFNSSANCIKAVDEPPERLVDDDCSESNPHDSSLNNWATVLTVHDIYTQTPSACIKKTLSGNFVYCFPWNVLFDKFGTFRCPPEVFVVPLKISFKIR